MNRTEKLYSLALCILLTLCAWYGTQKLGAETMVKVGVGCFGVGVVMQIAQSVKFKPRRKHRKV